MIDENKTKNIRIALVEALKFDERIWRAYLVLKPIHKDGLIDALIAALGSEVDRLRSLLNEACDIAQQSTHAVPFVDEHKSRLNRIAEIRRGLDHVGCAIENPMDKIVSLARSYASAREAKNYLQMQNSMSLLAEAVRALPVDSVSNDV